MSRARRLKKAAKGQPSQIRFERLYDKRDRTDPTYLRGQMRIPAPVKYSRCPVCVGAPHHSPWLDGVWS